MFILFDTHYIVRLYPHKGLVNICTCAFWSLSHRAAYSESVIMVFQIAQKGSLNRNVLEELKTLETVLWRNTWSVLRERLPWAVEKRNSRTWFKGYKNGFNVLLLRAVESAATSIPVYITAVLTGSMSFLCSNKIGTLYKWTGFRLAWPTNKIYLAFSMKLGNLT